MVTYIYFVKCPNCEDEHFDFFDEAKEFALGCLSQKPIITQTEVCRNDFGECTDSTDLGTVWSWEEVMKDTEAEPTESVFTKDDLKPMADGKDPEFAALDNSVDSPVDNIPDNFRKPVPADMTIEELVETMEENEDEVECTWCNDLFDKSECRREINLGWLCSRCEAAIKSRGEPLTFKENNYWDFLDEKLDIDFSNCVDSSDMEIWGLEHVQEDIYKAVLLKRFENVNYRSQEDEYQKVVDEMYDIDGVFTFSFGKNGLPELGSWNVNLLRKLGSIRIDFEDNRYENAVAKVFNQKTLKEEMSLTDLVKDSINHLVNGLGKDPLADDFADDVIGDLERNYYIEVPEGFTKYQEWCSAVASEVSRQVNNPDNLTEASLSDIAAAANSEFGTDYNERDLLDTARVEDEEFFDELETPEEVSKELYAKRGMNAFGSRKAESKLEELEEAADYKVHLTTCPECGTDQAFDHETGICINCGFNL